MQPPYQQNNTSDLRQFPALGELIDNRYVVKQQLGKGTYAAVFLVDDNKLGIEKALKVFGSQQAAAGLIPLIEREAKALAKLNHPGVVRVYDFNVGQKWVYLDLEYLPGGNLSTLLKSNPPDHKAALTLGCQLAEGLKAAHAAGLIHQDIKPANILLTSQQQARLGDFGLADNLQGQTGQLNLGTKSYMPPEKLKGLSTGQAGDVFSFGIVLYQLFHHDYPFTLDGANNPDYNLKNDDLDPTNKIDALIAACLANNPAKRPTAAKVYRVLARQGGRQNVMVTRLLGWLGRSGPDMGIQRNQAALLLITALLLVILTGLLLALPPLTIFGKPQTRPVAINAPGLRVAVNGGQLVSADTTLALKRGDLLQFYNSNNQPVFDMLLNRQSNLDIEADSTRVMLNGLLAGQVINSLDDLPVASDLAYLAININLPANSLTNQHNPQLAVRLGNNVNHTILTELPTQTKVLNINGNPNLVSLTNLVRLPGLAALDAGNTDNLQVNRLPVLNNLRYLNLGNVKQFTDLALLRPMPSLENLNLNGGPQQLTAGLQHLNQIRGLNSTTWQLYADSTKTPPATSNITTGQSKTGFGLRLDYLLAGLILLVLLVFLVTLLRLLFKPAKGGPTVYAVAGQQPNAPGDAVIQRKIDEIEALTQKGQLFTPQDENALDKFATLRQEAPANQQVQQQSSLLLNQVLAKVRAYYSEGLYEPAWLAATKANHSFADQRLERWAHKALKKLLQNVQELEFVKVKGGSFIMGDFTNIGAKDAPVHKVELSDFYISATMVTNAQFCRFLNQNGNQTEGGLSWYNSQSQYASIEQTDNRWQVKMGYDAFPVTEVSWHGALAFCRWAGGLLPSEAQWEYAARSAGKPNLYSYGNKPNLAKANYYPEQSRWHGLMPVKSFKPNRLGLYDMGGNAYQWCLDLYDPSFYRWSPLKNPWGPRQGGAGVDVRVIRGGAWSSQPHETLTFFRRGARALLRTNFVGFRVAKR